jgi:hypothetical protein
MARIAVSAATKNDKGRQKARPGKRGKMHHLPLAPLAVVLALLVAACSDAAGPPKTLAERNEVMDDFLSTSPTVSGDIPPADAGAPSP